MARARNIKPGFFANEDLVELGFATRLLFAGLWTLADREGRLEDRPKKIKIGVFPADDVNVDAMLQELHDSGFIERYVVNGARYVQIANWHKHQRPHHTEKASEIPEKDGSLTVKTPLDTGEGELQDGGNPPDSLIPDSLIPKATALDAGAPKPKALPPANPDKLKPAAFTPPDWVPADDWTEFVRMRRAMRNVPFTDAAARGVATELAKLRDAGHEPGQLLRDAVTNGWRTVYPPKGAQARASPPASKHAAAARAIYGAPSNPEYIDVETVVRQH